ncbi:hypothetical protein H6S82_29305 [Planktothrix sp. FACHB-1355]|uniref:Uncharacterized protein n=1 Tax=Aerosakkonema funiforme FACHB-1375 TaxID=2949571 RepID=A0A926ZHX5_9CYAN|nr:MULTISPECIES: hypothetical protein [Oscillatoriales]MBD2183803.1 hypothetical protein [Aerosakkonema funiforme FACHB-1375]MBD3562910.1 hypothetical protein [Planktothrix sp. FACHB-1355]
MAELPEETTNTVFNLQGRLLKIIHQAKATEFAIAQQYGETEATSIDLEQLQNIRERADTYYSRFYRLLGQIAEIQPTATPAMLDLLDRSIAEAQATLDALTASTQEIKRDWNI